MPIPPTPSPSPSDLTPSVWRSRLAGWLEAGVLPIGLLILLTGMLWAEERPEYHTLFYALVALPAFVLLLLKKDARPLLLSSPIFLSYLVFAAWVMLSIAWSDTDKSLGSLLKRPLYIAMLFAAVMQVGLADAQRIRKLLKLAVAIACGIGAVSLILFLTTTNEARLVGYRALSNPILTAHVFGFFLALCIAAWIAEGNQHRPWKILAMFVLGAVILATASRGGMAAAGAALLWSALLGANRRAAIACLIAVLACIAVLVAEPEIFTQRGLSLRPQLWAETLREVSLRPWLGYGYDAYIMLEIEGDTEKYPNPHSIPMAVLRQQGIIGLLLWIGLYGIALISSWRARRDPVVLICSAAVVSGLVAGLTEGISYLSRPKEHWFLIWIPLSLLTAALALRNKTMDKTHEST
ncbi:MAG: O-antigen ligase family protein [Parazoarcus communis]